MIPFSAFYPLCSSAEIKDKKKKKIFFISFILCSTRTDTNSIKVMEILLHCCRDQFIILTAGVSQVCDIVRD